MTARATPDATARLAEQAAEPGFYRPAWDGLTVASVGLGTYLGEPDDRTDARYAEAARRYMALGGNLIDSAINYRFQRSERSIGTALAQAVQAREIAREAVVVCTKGGYVSFDGEWPADPNRWIRQTFVEPGIAQPEDFVEGHCLAPAYLRHQIAQSLANLQVECLDLYYLHNPEGQRAALGEAEFRARLREAFAALEVAVAHGRIAAYGTATWNGYRARPEAPDYLSLAAIVEAARDVAGQAHHFRAIQLPFNFQMVEAFGLRNQTSARGLLSLLDCAAEHGVTVIASAPFLQSRLLGRLPDDLRAKFDGCRTDAQRALQFVRSTPGVTAALAGMSRPEHVEENMDLSQIAPLAPGAHRELFRVP